MIDIITTTDGPAAGGTCATPVGPAHPCAANCEHQCCHAGWFARKARADGLVYCCAFEGFVTPAVAYEHSSGACGEWDAA